MKRFEKINKRYIYLFILIAIVTVVLIGCFDFVNEEGAQVRSIFRINEVMTEAHMYWIILWEIVLIVFLILLMILSIALFIRYRRTEKRALEASIRARTLIKENEALDRISRMKTEFLQNMSHDFKTPLTVISTSVLNAIDVLDHEMDKEEIRDSLTLAQSEIMRMSRIVEGALKHAELHGSSQGTEMIDIEQLINKVSETYHAFLERQGNNLTITVPEEIPPVFGNTDMLLNVFSNLISNANRYTRNGEINIYAGLESDKPGSDNNRRYASIIVSDNGMGIKQENLADIFRRGASESGGTGLGLSICKTAVEALGGTINIESVFGIGTNISFALPIYNEKLDAIIHDEGMAEI